MQAKQTNTTPNGNRSAIGFSWRAFADKSRARFRNIRLRSLVNPAAINHARDLSLLLDATNAFASSRSLDELLDALCQKMTRSVESTYCRIYLLDESETQFVLRAAWAIRNLEWQPQIGYAFPLSHLPWHEQVLLKGEPLVVTPRDQEIQMPETERALVFSPGVRSVLLMPLITQARCLGIAALGEMRSWERTPFAEDKIELCRAMARQGAMAIENIRAIDAVARERQQFKLIVENVADGVFSTDTDGRILAFNPAAEKITGYSASEMVGHHCGDKLKGQDENGNIFCGSVNCPIQQVLHSPMGTRARECKKWIVRQDGTKRRVVHSIAPIMDQRARLIGTVSILRDVSREEELLHLKSEFISLVSHQIRTPLGNINMTAELLTNADLEESLRRELLLNLFQQSKRLSRLVNQVLESARLEQGQVRLMLEPLSLLPLIEHTVAIFQPQLGNRRFHIDVSRDLPFVIGDRISVEIVLENLLQNALNYSPNAGTITISAKERDATIVVSVMDQGIGIPVDQLDKVFQRYSRILTHGNTPSSGFGLGLYIAKMLVEAQGGTVWVESTSGQGACFRFTLQQVAGNG